MQVRMPTLVIFCVRTRTRKSVRVHPGASHWRHIPAPASCTLSMCFHTENSYFGHEWIRIGKLILGCRVVPIIVDTQHDDKLVGRHWYVLAFAVFLLGDCIYQMRSLCKHFCLALIKWTKRKPPSYMFSWKSQTKISSLLMGVLTEKMVPNAFGCSLFCYYYF